MKKGLLIIFVIALLGLAGTYAKDHKSSSVTLVGAANASPGSSASTSSSGSYKDGTYQGNSADTPYGTVQIAVVVSGGKITDVNFLQMPFEEDRSQQITAQAKPLLKQAAITAQSSNIDFVSGATSTSYGYQESLQAALDKAKSS